VLYWFRTPPGIKVGRSPFDPDMRRALEAQNPDVAFDWEAITHTPIPPPVEPERWRERRRVERAFRESEESAAISDASELATQPEATIAEPKEASVVDIEELSAAQPDEIEELNATAEREPAPNVIMTGPIEATAAAAEDGEAQEIRQSRQGRRRRRRRGRRKPQVQGSGFTVPGSQVPGSAVQDPEPDISNSQGPAIQDSGEPEDDNREP
jgi:hypothetical protein